MERVMVSDGLLILGTEDWVIILTTLLIVLAFLGAVLRDYTGWLVRTFRKIKEGFERD